MGDSNWMKLCTVLANILQSCVDKKVFYYLDFLLQSAATGLDGSVKVRATVAAVSGTDFNEVE